MALFGSWLDNLLNGSPQPPPSVMQPPPDATWPGPLPSPAPPQANAAAPAPGAAPAATPDAIAQLAQARAQTLPYQKGWQRGLGIFGSALRDAGMAWGGHPEAANNLQNFVQGLRQQRLDQLGLNAQNEVFGNMAGTDAGKPLPADIPLQIAKLQALGVDTGPLSTYMSTRAGMLPKYDFHTDGEGNLFRTDQYGTVTPIGQNKPIVIGPGQSLFQPGAPGADGSTAAPAATPSASRAPTGPQFEQVAASLWPGAKVTSRQRTPGQNAAVGGVPNSAHLEDSATEWARDLKLPDGVAPQDAAAQINASGIPGLKAIYEGPGAANSTAPHLHVQYIAPAGTPSSATPSPTVSGGRILFQAPQEWRDPTAAELEAHPGVSQVNGATGELKYTPQSSIPPDQSAVHSVAKAIANYQQAPFTGFVMKSPYGQQVMAEVMNLNPQYQAEEFPARSAAYKAFKTGPQGNLVRSFNVGISHLNSLQSLTAALGNGNIQLFNKIGQTVAEQTGQTAPTNFDAAKAIVGDEIIKAIVGGGGALADRENAQNQISRAKSPQQLLGVIQTYKTLMAGQLSGLSRQYQNATGRNDFDQLLAPETKAELEKHVAPAPGGSPQAGVVRVNGPADAAKLPKGTRFMTPDGRVLERK